MSEGPLRFEDLSNLKVTVHTLGDSEPFEVTVVGFEGDYGHGSQGNEDGEFMGAMMTLTRELWPSRDTVLDFRRLDYEWGDWIQNALPNERLAIVVSDRCRTGLTSLVKEEMGKSPENCLFDSVEEAILVLKRPQGGLANAPAFIQRHLQDRSALRIALQAVPLGPEEGDQALLLGVEGTWKSPDAGIVRGYGLAALECWPSAAVIFDFRALEYREGPEMRGILTLGKVDSPERSLMVETFGQAGDGGYPGKEFTCVLVSDLCREGIQRVLQSELKVPVTEWMFEDLESAVRSLRTRRRSGPGFLPL